MSCHILLDVLDAFAILSNCDTRRMTSHKETVLLSVTALCHRALDNLQRFPGRVNLDGRLEG